MIEPPRAGRLQPTRTWTMAAVFGAVSVPWTLGFEQVAGLPLWPAFIASATYFAAGSGTWALARGLAGNLAGALYAAGTLALVAAVSGQGLALAVVVGLAMFVASLHPFVPLLSFTPAAFFGYATYFSVEAAGARLVLDGLAGTGVATAASLAIGALIGWGVDGLVGALVGPGAATGA